jgi:hypothetical protein
MVTLMRRLRQEEDGYSLVIAMLLLAIMGVLLVVGLDAGTASLKQSSLAVVWSKALTVAEAGLNDSITRLGESRNAAKPCDFDPNNLNSATYTTTCAGGGGEYQAHWTQAGGKIIVTSIGYFPSKTNPTFTREVQATYEPVPSFKYALFSQTSLDIKQNTTVMGDVYSDGDVNVGNNAEVCGSISSSAGGVTLGQNDQVVASDVVNGCSGKSGRVWTGGPGGIVGNNGVVIAGDAIAGAPSTIICSSFLSSYAVTNATVQGAAKACGPISGITGETSSAPGLTTTAPVPVTFPVFVFDPNNYPSASTDPLHLQCFPTGGTCGSNLQAGQIAAFNSQVVATHKTSLTGTYAVWQDSPQPMSNPGNCTTASTTQICLDQISLSGDFTLITNAPVDFGNTHLITTTSPSADLVVVSTYQPTSGTTCTTNGGDCSIYSRNKVEFDGGDPTNPDDGVVGLLYTTGKMGINNQSNNPNDPLSDGALYGASMDFKNNYDINYNSRVERVLGFGTTYERTLWQELNV